MSFRIIDGTGSGKEAGVDLNNRLLTNTINETIANHIVEYGGRFNINTGNVTLTSTSESAVLYFKNNEDDDYSLTGLVYNIGSSTGGTGQAQCDVYFKTTGGTIVSGATPVDMLANHNLGSARTLSADVYKGAEGLTQTGGQWAVSSLITSGNRAFIDLGQVVIPKGQSIAVTITPPAGNTSMVAQVAMIGYVNIAAATGGSL